MPKMLHSLLDDPLISVRTTDDAVVKMTLPQIYVALADATVVGFEALQPHQKQPWFSFLVQAAAMAIARAGRTEAPRDAVGWRELLVELSEGSETAWCLVVDDVSKPALLQPPIPEGSIDEAGFKSDVPTPDELDMLITTKTHDVKQRRIVGAAAEHWLFALLTLQTMEGFLGRGNYGIVRMNGGFGSRPHLSLASALDWGSRFWRDLAVLLAARDEIAATNEFNPKGHALIWLEPWDGKKSSAIPLGECDPYFVEVCRRLRFAGDDQIECWRANTKGTRIDAPDDLSGRTGDPWTPINVSGAKALTLGGDGYTYKLLQDIWFGDDYRRPPALEFQRSDPQHAYLVATTLVRGQGKTKGFHQRVIPVPKAASRLLAGSESDRKKLAKRAQRRVQLAGEVQSKVLRGPTFTLVYGGRSPSDPNWDKVNSWLEEFDRRVDARFFDDLWDSLRDGLSDDDAEVQWHGILREIAEEQYREIRRSVPLPSIHRYRVLSQADGQFYGRLRTVLHRAFDDDTNDQQDFNAEPQEETNDQPALT